MKRLGTSLPLLLPLLLLTTTITTTTTTDTDIWTFYTDHLEKMAEQH